MTQITMADRDNVELYLKRQGLSRLRIVAARANVSEGDLIDIVENGMQVPDSVAKAVMDVMRKDGEL